MLNLNAPPAEPWFVYQAAARLSISETVLLRNIREGRIPAIKFGRRYRIPAYAMNAMIEGRPIPDCYCRCCHRALYGGSAGWATLKTVIQHPDIGLKPRR